MLSQRSRPRPLSIPHRKHGKLDSSSNLTGGTLSPDIKPDTPPNFPSSGSKQSGVSKIGKYVLLSSSDKETTRKSLDTENNEECVCKVFPAQKYHEALAPYWNVESHEHISQIEEIILGTTKAYVFFNNSHGDLHSYIRNKRRLKEAEAAGLFYQIVSAVAQCHQDGVVLRDLKLRKFVFKDQEKTHLMLDGLEDALILDTSEDDLLSEKHGCPAYVSPEILNTDKAFYSGKAADIWSLGVILYTMLIGRYPFHDNEPSALFRKICRGQYSLSDSLSSRAKCLVRNLLRMNPAERLTAEQILQHPWFQSQQRSTGHSRSSRKDDQAVPDIAGFVEDQDYLSLA